jgi:hypothetical protein
LTSGPETRLQLGLRARERIAMTYHIEKREAAFAELLEKQSANNE